MRSKRRDDWPHRAAVRPLDPDDVAAALLGCLGDPRFVTYGSEREEMTASKKAADLNGWLAAVRQRFTPS